tara:strand:+ start:1116 stop:1508 length:393 start_codon:yes stop_codon:yes gene_type:complete
MKKLIVIPMFLFTLIFSSTSLAGWDSVTQSVDGNNTLYVDFDRIRKNDGFIYFWVMRNSLKPDESGNSSSRAYYQGDCKIFKSKILSITVFKEQKGRGTGETDDTPANWMYPSPHSMHEILLNSVCDYEK